MKPGPVKVTCGTPLSAAEFELLLRRAAGIVRPLAPQLVRRAPSVRKRPSTAA
jgi:hypothetical protein